MSGLRESVWFTGNWDMFKAWTAWIAAGGYTTNAQDHLRLTGNAVRKLLRGHIMFQDMGWKKLHDRTIAQKGHGLVYIETQAYVRRLRVTSVKRKHGAVVNIAPGTHVYTRSGKSAAEVAYINEYGGPKIPARPVWRPVFLEMQALPEIANIPIAEILELHRWAR